MKSLSAQGAVAGPIVDGAEEQFHSSSYPIPEVTHWHQKLRFGREELDDLLRIGAPRRGNHCYNCRISCKPAI
jgi:hypothetical protein